MNLLSAIKTVISSGKRMAVIRKDGHVRPIAYQSRGLYLVYNPEHILPNIDAVLVYVDEHATSLPTGFVEACKKDTIPTAWVGRSGTIVKLITSGQVVTLCA